MKQTQENIINLRLDAYAIGPGAKRGANGGGVDELVCAFCCAEGEVGARLGELWLAACHGLRPRLSRLCGLLQYRWPGCSALG
jgi:hypothetical protein